MYYFADQAIDKVYQVYGEGKLVTYILQEMQKHKKNGGHPQLQI